MSRELLKVTLEEEEEVNKGPNKNVQGDFLLRIWTNEPTTQPTPFPTPRPSPFSTPQPSSFPTPQPSSFPTPKPTTFPTPKPTPPITPFPTTSIAPTERPLVDKIVDIIKSTSPPTSTPTKKSILDQVVDITNNPSKTIPPELIPPVFQSFPTVAPSAPPTVSLAPTERNFLDDAKTITFLVVGEDAVVESLKKSALRFEQVKGGSLRIEVRKAIDAAEMVADTQLDTSSYAGYIISPKEAGNAGLFRSFKDITEYLTLDRLEWDGIYPSISNFVSSYNYAPYMFPLDGGLLSMYYRMDILHDLGLSIPRTWAEYNELAALLTGQEYKGTSLIGSCIPRREGCNSYYWTNLVHASKTQFQGTGTGFLFNPSDFTPLTGDAMANTLLKLEGQVLSGHPNEFDECNGVESEATIRMMNEGNCVLTFGFGNVFREQYKEGSKIKGLLGVAPVPGSDHIYDRDNNILVPCTEEICTLGYTTNDDRWVNSAPYIAGGGFAGAIPANVDKDNIQDSADFFAFASNALQKITDPSIFVHEPYRPSQLNIESYEDFGFGAAHAIQYFDYVESSLNSPNAALDVRFPESNRILEVYESLITNHLRQVKETGRLASVEERNNIVNSLNNQWNEIIAGLDSSTDASLLGEYQRTLNFVSSTPLPPTSDTIRILSFGFDTISSTSLCLLVSLFMILR